jgi:hypothetical protein
MGTAVAERPKPDIARVILGGDLSQLTDDQRLQHCVQLCKRLGIDYSSRPFEYIVLNKKLTLYARKDCTDQLRVVHDISLGKPEWVIDKELGVVTAWVEASYPGGRKDGGTGCCTIMRRAKNEKTGVYEDQVAPSEDVANAIMKAETKAKRRATLSLCGLGCLDEAEIETVKGVGAIQQATVEQLRTIDALLKKTGANTRTWLDKYEVQKLSDLNGAQAGEIIAWLEGAASFSA